jgi:hypothetical protein
VKVGRDPRLKDLIFNMAVFKAFSFFLKERILKISEDILYFLRIKVGSFPFLEQQPEGICEFVKSRKPEVISKIPEAHTIVCLYLLHKPGRTPESQTYTLRTSVGTCLSYFVKT